MITLHLPLADVAEREIAEGRHVRVGFLTAGVDVEQRSQDDETEHQEENHALDEFEVD